MTNKLTREEMQELISALRLTPTSTVNGISLGRLADALSENEAAMGSEPVAWRRFQETPTDGGYWILYDYKPNCSGVEPLYRHAQQPTPERDQVRREHAEWSQATFGDVGPIGPLKHLSKEALEAAADPHDPLEWADMQFLFWDAQRRMGISDEFITRAMVEKLAINKARQWPEPKDGEPRLHIKEQPAPVVPCPFPCGWDNLNKLAIQNSALVARYLSEGEPVTEEIRQAAISNNDSLLKVIAACRAAMLQVCNHDDERCMLHVWTNPDFNAESSRGQSDIFNANGWHARFYEQNKPTKFPYDYNPGNSPVIPEGYVMVPKEPTEEMIAAAMNCDDVLFNSDESFCVQFGNIYEAMLAAAPQEVK